MIGTQPRPLTRPVSSSTACATTESACTSNPTLVPLKLTGGLLICNCGSTEASVHPRSATHVRLQPEAFGLESAPIPSR